MNNENLAAVAADDIELYPVNREILVEKTHDVIREAIISGRFAQGQRINESVVARQLHISRGPIREALAALANEGLVVKSPNRGMFVISLSRADVDELYALRAMYEVFALRHTLAHGRPLPLTELEGIIAKIDSAIGRDGLTDEAPGLDLAFHTALLKACGQKRLITAWSMLAPQLQLLFHRRKSAGGDFAEQIGPSHDELLAALRTYDPLVAEHALREHIHGSLKTLITHWDDGAR